MKKCPYCAEEIQDDAIVCRYCGRNLPRYPVPPRPAKIRSTKKNSTLLTCSVFLIFTIIVGFCGLIILLGVLSSDSTRSSQSSGNSSSSSDGEATVLYDEDGEVFVAVSIDVYDEAIHMGTINDDLGIFNLIATGLLFIVNSGTEVLVIDSTYNAKKVRILEGEYLGASGWVFPHAVRTTK